MKIKYLTLFPHFYDSFTSTSIVKNAIDKKLIEIETYDYKDYVVKGRVDDKIVGGGNGNLIRYDVASVALNKIKGKDSKVILVTPKGRLFNEDMAKKLSKEKELIFVVPHFEGIDERIVSEVDYSISIGDYILSGGELASEVISDAIIRLVPGVINKDSLKEETFNDNLLEYAQYALPRSYNDKDIPELYLSGNHKEIEKARQKERVELTKKLRPDLYKKYLKEEKEK